MRNELVGDPADLIPVCPVRDASSGRGTTWAGALCCLRELCYGMSGVGLPSTTLVTNTMTRANAGIRDERFFLRSTLHLPESVSAFPEAS